MEVALGGNILTAATLVLALAVSGAVAAEPPDLQTFEFLVGEWAASGSGQPGSGTGTAIFAWSLQKRVILRTSYAEYPPSAGKLGTRHDDLMVLYSSPTGIRADYYDSEGHAIRYSVRSPAPGQAVFLSEPATGEPTFRLSYKLVSPDALDGEFEIAAPGDRDTFKPYLSWHSQRVTKPGK